MESWYSTTAESPVAPVTGFPGQWNQPVEKALVSAAIPTRVSTPRSRCPIEPWQRIEQGFPPRLLEELEPRPHDLVDVPRDLDSIGGRRRAGEIEERPCLARVLEHMRGSVNDESRDRRRSGGKPTIALLGDHDRLERDVLRAKELLDQATERSARVGKDDQVVLHQTSFVH